MECNDCIHYGLCQVGGLAPYRKDRAEHCRDFIYNERYAKLAMYVGQVIYIVRDGKILEDRVKYIDKIYKDGSYCTQYRTDWEYFMSSDIGKTIFLSRLNAQTNAKFLEVTKNKELKVS